MVENETLKEVNELTHAFGKAYGGEGRLLMCLRSQRASLYKERLGYTTQERQGDLCSSQDQFYEKQWLVLH
jgi:hypothetical protein